MAADFYDQLIFKTLGPKTQTQKVIDIFDMGYGWEVWAQVELSLVEKETLTDPTKAFGALTSFKRESKVYKGSDDRCDFMSSYSQDGGKHHNYHFVELKCLRKNKLSEFISAVRVDIRKVKAAEPKAEWLENAAYIGGWVVAITVNPTGDDKISAAMFKLAKDEGIEWIARGGEGIIGTWTWTRTLLKK